MRRCVGSREMGGDRCRATNPGRRTWRGCPSLAIQAVHLFLIRAQVMVGIKCEHLFQVFDMKGTYFWLVEETHIC